MTVDSKPRPDKAKTVETGVTALVHFNHSTERDLTTWPDMRSSAWKPNYGDMLVCVAILRQLALKRTLRVGFGYAPKGVAQRAIVRGSTYLHKRFDFAAANLTLDALDMPMAIVGLGAQNPEADVTFLDDHPPARDFIARLNEKSVSISVRGEFTAAVVERLGGRNIRVTGCPSLFYRQSCPEVVVPETLLRPERAIGVSLHSGLTRNIFCRDPVAALRSHGAAVRWGLENALILSLFEQGVMLEYDAADRSLPLAERRVAAEKVLERIGLTGQVTPERFMAHLVSVKSIEEWLAKARDLDAVIGFRFHGNMVALLQGRPCQYLTYDSRLEEFCRLYGLPWRDVRQDWADPVRVIADHDWGATNRRFAELLAELRAFYAENGFEMTF